MKFVNENEIDQLEDLNEFNEISSEGIKLNERQSLSESGALDKAENLYSTPLQGIIKEYMLEENTELEEVKQEETKIYYLALGDSLTRGVGDEERKNGYTKRLAEKIEQWSDFSEVILDNRGKRGRRSDQLLALLEKGHYDNEIKNSELITITIGGNDIMKVVKKDIFNLKKEEFDNELVEFELRVDKIIKEIRLRNPDVPIILIGLYNPFSVITDEITEFESIISEWNKSILEVSENYPNACFVDVEDLFDSNANLVYHTDFFHPNGYGYTIMTERIVSIMKNCNIEDPTNGLILFQ